MSKLKCGSCGNLLPTTEYSKCKRRKTGYQGKCKSCNKKDNDIYRKENPEYWSYENGYFSDKEKWKYISKYMAADKPIKIYKIVLPDGKVYIGSTKALLNVRMSRHLFDLKIIQKDLKIEPFLYYINRLINISKALKMYENS